MKTLTIRLEDILPEIYDRLLSAIPKEYWPLIQVYLRDHHFKPQPITVQVPPDIINKLSGRLDLDGELTNPRSVV